MPKGEKKSVGEKLEPTLKAALDGMTPEQLRVKVAEVALYKQAREDLMKTDPAVVEAREKLNDETLDYKEEIKGAKNQIAYIKQRLQDQGKL